MLNKIERVEERCLVFAAKIVKNQAANTQNGDFQHNACGVVYGYDKKDT